jgi:excisionase family DNA binding protein
MEDQLLTVEEVAKRLKLSTATVRRLLARGDIAAMKVGIRQWRATESAVAHYLSEAMRKPAASEGPAPNPGRTGTAGD